MSNKVLKYMAQQMNKNTRRFIKTLFSFIVTLYKYSNISSLSLR